MNCNDCTETQAINSCVTSLTVGTILPTETNVYVFIERTGNGNLIKRYEAVSTAGGVVTVDLTGDNEWLNSHHCYAVWVTLRDATDLEPLGITIADGDTGTAGTCVRMELYDTRDGDMDKQAITAQTLKI